MLGHLTLYSLSLRLVGYKEYTPTHLAAGLCYVNNVVIGEFADASAFPFWAPNGYHGSPTFLHPIQLDQYVFTLRFLVLAVNEYQESN